MTNKILTDGKQKSIYPFMENDPFIQVLELFRSFPPYSGIGLSRSFKKRKQTNKIGLHKNTKFDLYPRKNIFSFFEDGKMNPNNKSLAKNTKKSNCIGNKNETSQKQKWKNNKNYYIGNFLSSFMDIYGTIAPLSGLGVVNSLIGSPRTPAGAFILDVRNTQLNRSVRKITGNKNITVIKPKTVTGLPDDQIEVLRYHMNSIPNRKDMGFWTSEDYKRIYKDYASGDAVLIKAIEPHHMVENTLGQYSYHTDKFGNIIITDIYDYNTKSIPNMKGIMKFLRDCGGKYGSFKTEPDEGKIHYRINIGNPRFLWNIIDENTNFDNLIKFQ